MALNADLRSEEKCVLLVTKTLFNIGNGLKSLSRLFRKLVKPHITLLGFSGVEL